MPIPRATGKAGTRRAKRETIGGGRLRRGGRSLPREDDAVAHDPAKPQLEFIFRATVEVAVPRSLGRTPLGERRIIEILGGFIEGPRLSGTILPGGADWQIVREDGTAVLEARYTVQADDGSLVYVQNRGFRHGAPDLAMRIASGEEVDPATYYFRTVPEFETSAPHLAWLNRTVFVCSALRRKENLTIDFYAVR